MPEMVLIADVERDGFEPVRRVVERYGSVLEAAAQGVLIHSQAPIYVGALEAGMASGKASVSLCFELPDGRVVLVETSLALLEGAARALAARYG